MLVSRLESGALGEWAYLVEVDVSVEASGGDGVVDGSGELLVGFA